MDNLYSNNPRLGKIISVHGGMPVITGMSCHPSIDRGCRKALAKTPTVDPYSSRYNNSIKLLPSNSPPLVLDNFGPTAPLKLNMEEETLVVDGIPVESSYGGSSLAYSHSRRLMHRAVEDNITNSPGSKSHLTRGKVEQLPSRLSIKNNSLKAVAAAAPELVAPKCVAAPVSRPAQTHKPPSIKIPTQDWSPLDDGILVNLPSHTGKTPSREDVDACIHHFRNGPKTIRRLPVFTEITDP